MYIDTCVCVYIYICLRTSAQLNQMAVRFSNQKQYQTNQKSIDKQSNGSLKKSAAGRLIRCPCSGGDQNGALTLRMEGVGFWSTY